MKLTLPFLLSVNIYWRNTRKEVLISALDRYFRSNAQAACLKQYTEV